MDSTMLVRHFMTRQILTVNGSMRCRDALRFFKEEKLRRAPVMRGERLIGMLGLSDLLRILPGSVSEQDSHTGLANERAVVAQVMSTDLITLDPEDHLEDAAQKMITHKIGGIPVLHEGRLEGLLTESDLFRAFVGMTRPERELRVTFALQAGLTEAPDPVLIALRLGFRIRGYIVHARPGGEEIALMRLRGPKKRQLIESLGQAGYTVIEVLDKQTDQAERPAA
jgi:acetoin utilization protein AcuB